MDSILEENSLQMYCLLIYDDSYIITLTSSLNLYELLQLQLINVFTVSVSKDSEVSL